MTRTSFAGFGGEHHTGGDNHVLKSKADSLQTKTNIELWTRWSAPSTAKHKIQTAQSERSPQQLE